MKIVIINGSAGVGKDTFVQICQKEYSKGQIENISTVDLIKTAAKILGWNEVKDERGRKFLSDLKDLACNYSNLSSEYLKKKIKDYKKLENTKYRVDIIFYHCREPEEIDKLKEEFSATTLLIKNNRIKQVESNHADKNVENYKYDYIIENNSGILDLTRKAVDFLHNVGVL